MSLYSNVEQRKLILRSFIKNNPITTHRDIKKQLHMKAEKVYVGGMAEAFLDADVEPPRTFDMKDKEERKKFLIDYLLKNPTVGMQTVNKETKINYLSVFKDVKDFYFQAGISYERNKLRDLLMRNNDQRKQMIIKLLKENPFMSIAKIIEITQTHPYTIFKNIEEMYSAAGLKLITKSEKIRIKKRKLILNYIKDNPFATQREINRSCKTHVQLIFKGGIFEAYKQAGVNYPYDRIPFHGAVLKDFKIGARDFETEVALNLSSYGTVSRLVKTKRGFADIMLERKNKKVVIEVKNYKSHEISTSQVKQLDKYLEDCNCDLGFLVCRRKPLKDRFLIGKNTIIILAADELNKIPEVMDKCL